MSERKGAEDLLPLKVHVWTPDLFDSEGGIQRFSGYLIEALRQCVRASDIRVFSKNDREPKGAESGYHFHGSGRWPLRVRTPAYATRVVIEGGLRRPDLVIATHLHFCVAGRLLKQMAGVPYWCVAHGFEAWGLSRPDRIAGVRDADRILAVSRYTRDRLVDEQSLGSAAVAILPNTFDASGFIPGPKPAHLLRRHGIGAGKKIILTVSRLSETERYKGYDQIFRVLPRLQKLIPEIHYVLVGKGPDQERIEGLIKELGVGELVTLAGFVSDAELADYYNLCDVFAMPSKGEGFGIVYLEAMACGKPVLAGRFDGSSEPCKNGEFGVLVDPDNLNEIVHSLAEILKGSHPLRVLYDPGALRAHVIRSFGFDPFVANLRQQLCEFSRHQGSSDLL